jgi:hypothetical protein
MYDYDVMDFGLSKSSTRYFWGLRSVRKRKTLAFAEVLLVPSGQKHVQYCRDGRRNLKEELVGFMHSLQTLNYLSS